MNKAIMNFKFSIISALFIFVFVSCTESRKKEKGADLYQMHCARCHIAPDINHLPKEFWVKSILPEMAARMGIKDGQFKPYDKMGLDEMEVVHKSGIYPYIPIMNETDWATLKEYVLSKAPDSLQPAYHEGTLKEQTRFKARAFALDSVPGSFYTFLKYKNEGNKFWVGDISGQVTEYQFGTGRTILKHKVDNAVVDYIEKDTVSYITDIGILNPSELSSGKIVAAYENENVILQDSLHRPVNNLVADLNGDGLDEMVISEFGNLTGQLSLLSLNAEGTYDKKTLLYQPGAIRSLARDMDNDGKLDIVTLTSQGDETITILYQQEDLNFRSEKVLRFSPIFGSSWFELLDYDGDGDVDIVTVNGDNADKTYVQKPYHGLRIHLNDGKNQFKEAYFYPLNGATRFVANDFDQDGDYDFAVISTFPDYEKNPEYSLVYLENTNSASYEFQTRSFEETNLSRWFLLDTGDIDQDGDTDIVISAFTYVFVPVPGEITKAWNENNVDIMVLENNLVNEEQVK